ncbi:MAG TPA: hypothetical protein VF708_11930 [Pyrinomonadaceae bacterium]|jgi:hypothetical protein
MRRKRCSAVGLLFWAAVAALVNASLSQAQVSSVTNYQDSIGAGSKTTYLDALRKIFPDVKMEEAAVAHKTIPLSHLFGDYKGMVYEGEMKIDSIERLQTQGKNSGQLLVLVHASGSDQFNWGEISVLALFQLEPTLRLLDAGDVQADRSASFWEEMPHLRISPQGDAVIVASSHHNSSQSYLSLAMIATEGNKLSTVFDFPTLLHGNDCGNTFSQTPGVSVLRAATGAHFNILFKVKMVKEPDDASCEKKTRGYTRYYQGLLVWNSSKRRYETRGTGLARLSRFNEKSF